MPKPPQAQMDDLPHMEPEFSFDWDEPLGEPDDSWLEDWDDEEPAPDDRDFYWEKEDA